jgi:hypothetical protein
VAELRSLVASGAEPTLRNFLDESDIARVAALPHQHLAHGNRLLCRIAIENARGLHDVGHAEVVELALTLLEEESRRACT